MIVLYSFWHRQDGRDHDYDEFKARYEKAEARWFTLCGIDPKEGDDYDPHLAFAEYFDDLAVGI